MLKMLMIAMSIGFYGQAVYGQPVEASGFETKAKQALLIEEDTGTVLFSKKDDVPIPPASLTKLMTMEVVFSALESGEISAETSLPVSENAWRTGGAPSGTSTMFAAVKSSVSVGNLIQGVIVQAANDACIVLAEGLGGSEAKFAGRITDRAKALGMASSVFGNATGLPDAVSQVTMRDLLILARHIHSTYPQYYSLYSQEEFEWNKIRQRNRNPLLRLNMGVDGMAMGYAESSGYAIVATMMRDNTRLFLAMSGLTSDKERTEEARKILEWGASTFERRKLFEKGAVVGRASVYGGDATHLDLVSREPLDVFVPVEAGGRISAKVLYDWPLRAPIAAGTQVGTLQVFDGQRLLREVPVETVGSVGQGTLASRARDALQELLLFWL